MKLLSILLFLFSTSVFSQSLEKYVGCYKTLTFNGKEVDQGTNPKYAQTLISLDIFAFDFQRKDKTDIESLNLDIFTCHGPNCVGMNLPPGAYLGFVESIFVTEGNIDHIQNGVKFSFSGKVFSPPWDGHTYLESEIQVQTIYAGQLRIKAFRKNTIAGPRNDRENTWVIQKNKCL